MIVKKQTRNDCRKVFQGKINVMIRLATVAVASLLFVRCLMFSSSSNFGAPSLLLSSQLPCPKPMNTQEELNILESQVLQALSDRSHSIDTVAIKPMEDYKATKLQLSPGRPLYAPMDDFDFVPYQTFVGKDNQRFKPLPQSKVPETSSVKRLVCYIDPKYKNIRQWQHYIHMIAPCWSLFQRFPDAEHYINLDAFYQIVKKPKKNEIQWSTWILEWLHWGYWIRKLNEYYSKAGVKFIGQKPLNLTTQHTSFNGDYVASTLQKHIQNGHGWGDPTGEGPNMNSYYFMEANDIYKLQQTVLGSKFQSGPAGGGKIKLLILNRQGSGAREWNYADETHKLLQKQQQWSPFIDTKLVQSFDWYSFEQQAHEIHSADIIISPHGAQLTNLLFARPCTVLLELYPRNFYYPKKVPLLMEAGGIGFVGYHFDGSPVAETPEFHLGNDTNIATRRKSREVPIHASPSSILYAIPDLLHAAITCRKQSLLKQSMQGDVTVNE